MTFSQIRLSAIERPSAALKQFEGLLKPKTDLELESMAQNAARLTRQHFGKAIRLFAPLYLSNECINSCAYCGFSRENSINRVTLEVNEVLTEARHLAQEGFRNILLVAGEHPKFVSNGYLELCISKLVKEIPSISLEVAPMETAEYIPMVNAGAEGLIVYQETYHEATYATVHVAGPKKNYSWRLDTIERGYEAGFRRLGVGVLFGLWDWREEAMALAAHIEHLQRTCWKAQITVSLPRLRPAAGSFEPTHPISDRDFIQLMFALRLVFPHVGIVLSTREPEALRDAIISLGVTMMSAGSHTEPGGYTGQGKENLHLTVRGKALPAAVDAEFATGQFEISDERSAAQVADRLRSLGLEPVWKDWDHAILNS
ncbi:MAG: 2-iminoacetate synthase ThiH [Chthoniobacterales bacterium]